MFIESWVETGVWWWTDALICCRMHQFSSTNVNKLNAAWWSVSNKHYCCFATSKKLPTLLGVKRWACSCKHSNLLRNKKIKKVIPWNSCQQKRQQDRLSACSCTVCWAHSQQFNWHIMITLQLLGNHYIIRLQSVITNVGQRSQSVVVNVMCGDVIWRGVVKLNDL